MSTSYYIRQKTSNGNYINNVIIAHRAAGWKMLWNCNIEESYTGLLCQLYNLNRKSLIDFLYRDDIEILVDNISIINKEEFINMAFNWDNDFKNNRTFETDPYSTYRPNEDRITLLTTLGYDINVINDYQDDFIHDGLRWSIFNLN